jgi:hypothetical protein
VKRAKETCGLNFEKNNPPAKVSFYRLSNTLLTDIEKSTNIDKIIGA